MARGNRRPKNTDRMPTIFHHAKREAKCARGANDSLSASGVSAKLRRCRSEKSYFREKMAVL